MNRLQLMVAALLTVSLVGCASSAPQTPSAPPTAPAQADVSRQGDAMSLRSVRVENQPEARVIVETDGRPAYTGYHPQPDVYVVDLLKTVKQPGLVLPTNLPAYVASISADEVLELGKPLTRVTVRFREPVGAWASASGNGVEIGFEPPAAAPFVPSATEPEIEVAEIEQEPHPLEVSVPVETPVLPRAPVPVASNPATRLDGITTNGSGDSLSIALESDGRLEYHTFKLTNPLRLVVDLKGTTNKVGQSTIQMNDPFVRQIRVAQFQSQPEPITRVVLDLDELPEHHVRLEGRNLIVDFGTGPRAPVRTAEAEPRVTAAPVRPAPASSIAEIEPIAPAYVPTERAVIRGPQVSPANIPELTEASNVTTPRPAPDLLDADRENVFLGDAGPEVIGGIMQTTERRLSPGDRIYSGDPIDLELTNADIKDVLRTFAQLTGLNIAIDPNVQGQVTVSFVEVPWDQALDTILRQNGLTYTIDGNVMRVGTLDRIAAEEVQTRRLREEERLNVDLTTVIKRLSYAKADVAAGLVTGLASPRGKIIVDQRTNQLIITDVPQYIPTMLNLIENIDIATPQVLIEARIVETTKTFARQLGVNWGFQGTADPALGSGTGLVFPNRIDVVGGPFNFGAGNPVLDLSFGSVLGTFDLDLTLTAAENEGLVRIISAPKVMTQDNQPAEIQSGLQIPFQTRVNFTTTVSFIDATLRLSVTPQITAEDTVIMDIQVQKVEPLSGLDVAGATNPPLSTRRAQTRLMVRDGGTTVIGGIYQSTDNNAENRLPFLHQIPVLGNLFKSRRVENRNDELLIFITPRIARNI
ncbi:MAG: type IV pilus secretin PilQ [Thermoanaerobaculia bacterium]